MADLEPIPYSDQKIRRILESVRTIAMVGASSTGTGRLFRDEVSAGEGLPGHPVIRASLAAIARRDRLCLAP